MPETHQEISIRVQEKFEFYFLSLTFVILGLSIQTSEFGFSLLSDGFELLGWISLFISCLTGLSRMEWVPLIHNTAHEQNRRMNYYDEANFRRLRGESFVIAENNEEKPIDDFINEIKEGIEVIEKQTEELDKKSILKYRIHKYAFALGLFFLMCSRGYEPFLNITGCNP